MSIRSLRRAYAKSSAALCHLGALSGAVVLGPAGASAGAVIGFTAGPVISHSWGARGPEPQRRENSPKRSVSTVSNETTALTGGRPLHGLPQHSNPKQRLQSLSQRRDQRPQHLRGQRPKIYATCSNLGVIKFTASRWPKLMRPPLDAAQLPEFPPKAVNPADPRSGTGRRLLAEYNDFSECGACFTPEIDDAGRRKPPYGRHTTADGSVWTFCWRWSKS